MSNLIMMLHFSIILTILIGPSYVGFMQNEKKVQILALSHSEVTIIKGENITNDFFLYIFNTRKVRKFEVKVYKDNNSNFNLDLQDQLIETISIKDGDSSVEYIDQSSLVKYSIHSLIKKIKTSGNYIFFLDDSDQYENLRVNYINPSDRNLLNKVARTITVIDRVMTKYDYAYGNLNAKISNGELNFDSLILIIMKKKSLPTFQIGEHTIDEEAYRVAATHILGSYKYKDAIRTLCHVLTDPSEKLRIAAAGALGDIGSREAIQCLIAAMQMADKSLRNKIKYEIDKIVSQEK